MQESVTVITVDGPSGVGKGTLAKKLAQKLAWHLDSGAIYRVLALATLRMMWIAAKIINRLLNLDVRLIPRTAIRKLFWKVKTSPKQPYREPWGGCGPNCGFSACPRTCIVSGHFGVSQDYADGRDMGTVVFRCRQSFFDATAEKEQATI